MNNLMIVHLEYVVTLTLAALSFALVEIQIEGQHGWASNLPTWKVENRWTHLFCGRRPLTGYHLYAQFFVLCSFTCPSVSGWPLSAFRTKPACCPFSPSSGFLRIFFGLF